MTEAVMPAPGQPSDLLSVTLRQVGSLLQRGDSSGAIERCQALLSMHPGSVEVLHYLALGHLQQDQLSSADTYLSLALRAAPASPSLLSDMGIIRLKQKNFKTAIDLFVRALELDPLHCDALSNVSTAFTLLRQPVKAKDYLERLVRVQPLSPAVHVKCVDNCLALNEVEDAIQRGRKAVRLAPHDASARLALADALEAGGRFDQAKFQYLVVLRREPSHIAALSRFLALRGTHISPTYPEQARRILNGAEVPDANRIQLQLGLARYFDHRGNCDDAFKHLKAGNDSRHKSHPFDSDGWGQTIDRLISTFTADFFNSLPSRDVQSMRPIFIVGMPRSGTTLVEQILSSHSQVEAGGELSTISNIAAQMSQDDKAYPEKMRDVDQTALARMAQRYLEKLSAISTDAARVTDKMPFNFIHLGLIAALFPEAKIIHCRRNPLDTCLSCYFTTFSEHLQFASDLEALGRYYLDYRRVMRHWQSVLPVPIMDLDYETLVEDTEGTVRKLLTYCQLEWESSCLTFYQSRRGVRTPSRWQVRQPVYGHSIGRWRHYERQLQPLVTVLSPVLIEQDLHDSTPA